MAGHSQFKNIMHRKGRQDAARSKLFSKLAREITVAAKVGGSDPAMNPRLRVAIQNAKMQSMPKENIQRAVGKAQSDAGGDYAEIRYEGYGPGGVALIVEALSDNRNRTASNIRSAFAKNGGALAETGSVAFLFERVGEMVYPCSAGDPESVLEKAVDAGATDVLSSEDAHLILCNFEDIGSVSAVLGSSLGEAEQIRVVWKPLSGVAVDQEQGTKLVALITALEDDEDVQNVYANFEMDEALIAYLTGEGRK